MSEADYTDWPREKLIAELERLRTTGNDPAGQAEPPDASGDTPMNVRFYEDIARNIRIGLYIYHLEDPNDDRSLRLIAANPAAEDFTGVSAARIVGKTLDDNFPGLREQGIPQTYARAALTGDSFELGDVYYDRAGVRPGWYNVRAFALPGCCVGVCFDEITLRKGMEEELRNSRQELRELGRHLEQMREEERSKVVRQVHEGLGQLLVALRMQVDRCRSCEQPSGSGSPVNQKTSILELVDKCLVTVREITAELRPPELEHLGLVTALQAELARFGKKYSIPVNTDIAFIDDDLSAELSTAVYRMLVDTLRTLLFFSTPQQIAVALSEPDGGLVLSVVSEGQGLPPDVVDGQQSFHLVEIRERALACGGELDIDNDPGEGVAFKVTIPSREP